MKQNYFLRISLFLFINVFSFAQDRIFETRPISLWTQLIVRISEFTKKVSNCYRTKAIIWSAHDVDKSNAHITTPVLNTCGTVSFKYAYVNGSSSNVFQFQISTDGTNYSTLDTHTLGASSNQTYTDYSYNVNNLSNTVFYKNPQ